MLNDSLRQELIEVLAHERLQVLFGDGLEMDYVMDGCNIVGLTQMNDEELVEEYEDYNNDENDEFLIKLKTELESHKLLAST